jgi:replicative DNA helicase
MTDVLTGESFGQYGKAFQERIMQALLTDPKWAEQLMEVFDVKFLDLKYLQYLSERYFDYAKKYKDFPSVQMLATIIRDELKLGNDKALAEQIVDYLRRVQTNPNPQDLPFVKDKALDFCRRQALKGALEKAVDLVSSEKYESIVDIIKHAVSVGTTPSLGHDLIEDIDARFVSLVRNCVPTGIPQLDHKDIMQGGLGKGELGCVMGSTGTGKSHFLVMLGANALRVGCNVLHYTFELSEAKVGIRYDSNLVDIDSTDVIENKEQVKQYYDGNKTLGRLKIKHFPTGTATIYTIKAHIEKLALKGFKPDLVLIDYADIMRSTRQYDSLRHELKLIYEELRGYAEELGIPIWTASQVNKEGSDSEIVDLSNMSEAYGKAFVADVIVSISRRAIEKSSGFGRLFIAKNRAGRDGLIWGIKIDTARSKFDVIQENVSREEVAVENEGDFKKALAAKWNKVQRDADIGAKKLIVEETQKT